MDEDRIKGSATDIGGRLKETVGDLVGDGRTQAGGKADQLSGRARNVYGSARDTVREGASPLGSELDTLLSERPITSLLMAVGAGYVLARLMHHR